MTVENYKGYTKDDDQATVRALFVKKYGYEPESIEDGGTIWLAGPIRRGPGLHGELLQGE